MRSDDDIYNDIGGILFEIAPDGACKVIMRAQLSQELDSCEYEYDYIDEQGNVAWFTAGGRVNTDILDLLMELRRWYVENKLTGGLPAWSGCEVALDLIKFKICIDFMYVHSTPGVSGPGPQRIVVGKGGEMYYTADHYKTFIPVNK